MRSKLNNRLRRHARRLLWGSLIISAIALMSSPQIGLRSGRVFADTPLSHRPAGVRIGHLSSDPVPGRSDYVIVEKAGFTYIDAFSPGGTLLFHIDPYPSQPIRDLIDVVDLDGDGNSEIIGMYRGDGLTGPALYVLNGDGSIRYMKSFDSKLAASDVKIYDVWPVTGERRIVVALDTFSYSYPGTNPIYFFGPNGQIASPSVPRCNCGFPGEDVTFPGVVIGDVDTSSGYDIFVVAKSRILAFDQNGGKRYYRQFADPLHNDFINYTPDNDPWGGRRYGMFQLADVDGNGVQDLIVAADAQSPSPVNLGAAYEVYPVYGTVQSDGYQPRMWNSISLPNSNAYLTLNVPADSGYTPGVTFGGIGADLNADGIPDLLVTDIDPFSNMPFIRVINTRTGSVTGNLISNSVCVGVRVNDLSQPSPRRPDVLVYNVVSGTHSVYRFNAGSSYTPTLLGNFGTPSQTIVIEDPYVTDLTIAFYYDVGISANQGHLEPMRIWNNGTRGFAAYTPSNCPTGLVTWTISNGVLAQSLNVAVRPGEVISTPQTGNSPKNSTWVIDLETSCGTTTHILRSYVQSGASLVASGDL
jgi:hypothetical protein